jgi:hypothetical protein
MSRTEQIGNGHLHYNRHSRRDNVSLYQLVQYFCQQMSLSATKYMFKGKPELPHGVFALLFEDHLSKALQNFLCNRVCPQIGFETSEGLSFEVLKCHFTLKCDAQVLKL